MSSALALADLLGLTRAGISALAASGILERRADGMFDTASSVQRYCAHLRDAAQEGTTIVSLAAVCDAFEADCMQVRRAVRRLPDCFSGSEHDIVSREVGRALVAAFTDARLPLPAGIDLFTSARATSALAAARHTLCTAIRDDLLNCPGADTLGEAGWSRLEKELNDALQ
ncbi:hypothetical protein RDV64_19835 [Acuticoccus sp. MNP-M23]|uniref:hypothetical protein n=1 Tax=Acuticoccus sp. MNP-M23 TaxID=3072793 RepID=UPI002815214A|nr:hypothetical protein [Acuticoccus sp. MNP-M23]WMS42289.1 hypothetical protein RDV64_19835 [Acuticoccus sp. MNP-M23]